MKLLEYLPVIRKKYDREKSDVGIDEAFCKYFGLKEMPDELNQAHELVIVASNLDASYSPCLLIGNTNAYFDRSGTPGNGWEAVFGKGYCLPIKTFIRCISSVEKKEYFYL